MKKFMIRVGGFTMGSIIGAVVGGILGLAGGPLGAFLATIPGAIVGSIIGVLFLPVIFRKYKKIPTRILITETKITCATCQFSYPHSSKRRLKHMICLSLALIVIFSGIGAWIGLGFGIAGFFGAIVATGPFTGVGVLIGSLFSLICSKFTRCPSCRRRTLLL